MWAAGGNKTSGFLRGSALTRGGATAEPLQHKCGYTERRRRGGSAMLSFLLSEKKKEKTEFSRSKKKGSFGSQHCNRCLAFLSFWLIELKAINVSLTVLQATAMATTVCLPKPSSTKHLFSHIISIIPHPVL